MRRRFVRAAGFGLLLTFIQLGLVGLCSGKHEVAGFYESLRQWDTHWYTSIAEKGYISSLPPKAQDMQDSNVAFFPAFPLLGRGVAKAFHIQTELALILAAQLCAWAFWSLLWLFLWESGFSLRASLLCCGLILSHPGAFFLVAGYSESQLLACAVFFLLLTSRINKPASFARASLIGGLMTATRLVGLPILAFPLLKRFCAADFAARREAPRLLGLVGLGSLGALGFFLYCHFHFGAWDLYFQTEWIGWKVRADPFGLFKPRSYAVYPPSAVGLTLDSLSSVFTLKEELRPIFLLRYFDRLLVPLMVLTLALSLFLEWLSAKGRYLKLRTRVPFYAVAAMILYISASAKFEVEMVSMIRFSLPVCVFLAIPLVEWGNRQKLLPRSVLLFCAFLLLFSGLGLQLLFAYRFTHGEWVG